ncbi:MAG: AAA family ATPase, partial [Fimbriimonadales bacterium]|nr:AAA family ATPase [Fimbriimonadales bacterium]
MWREERVITVRQVSTPIADWLSQLLQGRGGTLLIVGEPGMGRTAALRALVAQARGQGFAVADSWCRGDAAEPPHLPLAALLDTLLHELGAAGSPLQEPYTRWLQNPQAWHLPTRLIYPLREIARQRPVLLALDDAHLAHENLLRTLLNWLVALRLEPIGVVLTAVSPLKSPALLDLQRAITEREAGELWTLRALTREEVAALLQERLPEGTPADTLCHTLYELTGGNLLYLSEILSSLSDAPAESLSSLREWIPDSLREALLRRFVALAPVEQVVGQALSLFERVAPRAALPLITRLTERAVAKGVQALQSLGWVETQGTDELRWRNRLYREVVYSTIEPRQRTQWHERAADALKELNAPELVQLQQLRQCEPTPERLNRMHAAYLRLRGLLAPRPRLELLDACLDAAAQLGDDQRRTQLLCERPYLLFQLPNGLLRALDASQYALAMLEAHPEADPERELWVQVSCAKAGQLTQLGRAHEAQHLLQQLLTEPTLTDSQRLMGELSLAYVYACRGELRRAYAIHKSVWARLQRDQAWLMRWGGVLRFTVQYALACGDLQLAAEAVDCLEDWSAQPDFPQRFQMLYQLVSAELAYFHGRGAEQHTRARAILEAGEQSGEQLASLEPWFLTLLYRQPLEAVRVAERALTLAQSALGQEREAEWRYRKAQALLEAEQYDAAQETAQAAYRAALKADNQWLLAKTLLTLGLIQLAQQRFHEARHALERATPLVQTLDLPDLHCERALLLKLLHLSTDSGLPAEGAHAVDLAESWGHALYRGLAYALRARETGDPADAERAEALLAEYGAPLFQRLLAPRGASFASSSGWDIYIHLLGEGSVRFRAARMGKKAWQSPRARALFAHLVLQNGAPVDTHTLLEQHFPHLDPDRARVNLQTVISAARRSLRKAFGDSAGDWIHHENGLYRWASPYPWRTDLQAFEQAA